MSIAHTFFRSTAAALLLLGATQIAQAQTVNVNFDDLGLDLGAGIPISSPYNGLTWSLASSGNAMGYMTQGNTNYTGIVCRSGNNCAFNAFGLPSGVYTATTMTFSGWMRRWNWTNNTGSASSVLIEALNAGGTVVSAQTLTLSDSYQAFNFSTLFTTLRFTPTGGSGLGCDGPVNCGYFLLDDVIINPVEVPQSTVPEPSEFLLVGASLLGLIPLMRRRLR